MGDPTGSEAIENIGESIGRSIDGRAVYDAKPAADFYGTGDYSPRHPDVTNAVVFLDLLAAKLKDPGISEMAAALHRATEPAEEQTVTPETITDQSVVLKDAVEKIRKCAFDLMPPAGDLAAHDVRLDPRVQRRVREELLEVAADLAVLTITSATSATDDPIGLCPICREPLPMPTLKQGRPPTYHRECRSRGQASTRPGPPSAPEGAQKPLGPPARG